MFVGREPELAVLAAQVRAACRGQGRVVLIGGEPGIGKTRVAQEASARAAAAGWRCVRARASEDEGCPPYWLFRQVVRDVAAIHDPRAGQRADLAIVAPGLWRQAVEPGAPAERRFEMFESVREFLADAAAGTGLLVVLDDLHWADVPSLRLLRHLAAGIGTARLLVLATYRDTESAGRDELRAFLAALAREDAVSRIRLAGLTQDQVACQLAAITGSQVAPEVAAAVSRRTHGNPFFVAELGRLVGSGASGLPEAVRDAVRARLGALTPGCQAMLCPAAVLGAAIDPSAVAVVTQRDVGTVLACLDEAAAGGLVTSGGGWQFSHDLIRETALLELPTADRLTAHARMAGYLRCRADAVPAVVAHHLLESLPTGDAALAARWAERAAAAAMAHLAWEDAAGFYDRALRAAAGQGAADRCRLLRGLGVAQLRSFDLAAATVQHHHGGGPDQPVHGER